MVNARRARVPAGRSWSGRYCELQRARKGEEHMRKAVVHLLVIGGVVAVGTASGGDPALAAKAGASNGATTIRVGKRQSRASWLSAVLSKPDIDEFAAVAFDRHEEPWVVYTKGPCCDPAPYVAQLTPHGFAHVHRILGPAGMEMSVRSMLLDRREEGVLLLSYSPPAEIGEKLTPVGLAVEGWHPGARPGMPVILAEPSLLLRGDESIAMGSRGTAVIVWSTETDLEHSVPTVQMAHVKKGEVLEFAQLSRGEHEATWMYAVGVWPSGADGFEAVWQARGKSPEGVGGEEAAELATAHTGASGVFSAPLLSPWPAPEPEALSEGRGTFADASGDQALAWFGRRIGGPGSEHHDLYIVSRAARQPFGAPQLLGAVGEYLTPLELAIGPSGRVSVLWEDRGSGELMAAAGPAGGQIGAPRLVARNAKAKELRLIVTPRGETIAVWANRRPTIREPGETVVEAAASADGAHFTRPQIISRTPMGVDQCGGSLLLVPDPAGGALASWRCEGKGLKSVTEYSRYVDGR
jgi:hypothetical protein